MEEEKKITETTGNTDAAEVTAEAAPEVKTEPAPAQEEPRQDKLNKGKYAEYSDHDLQTEILKYEKKAAKRTMLVAIALFAIAAVFVVAAIIIVPPVVKTLEQVQTTLTETTKLVGKAEETLNNLDESLDGMNTMISDVDGVLVDNTEAMEEAIAKIGSIDVDGLNESIQDLNKVVSSMGRLFGA